MRRCLPMMAMYLLVFSGLSGCTQNSPAGLEHLKSTGEAGTAEKSEVSGESELGVSPEAFQEAHAGTHELVFAARNKAGQIGDASVDYSSIVLDPTKALPDSVSEALSAVPFDPRPESLTLGSHYFVSNENFHHLFRDAIDDHGGIFLGVGTDQNYIMGAWARSPVLLMMDFDHEIQNLHKIYGVLILNSPTPQDFIRAWSSGAEEESKRWLAQAYEAEELEALNNTWEKSRASVFARLRHVRNVYQEREIPSFVTDDEDYAFVRTLWQNGRVFAYRGDLTADETMVEIASTLRQFGLNLGLVYLSNTEQYFDFTPEYRRNIAVQPFAAHSLILRTRPMDQLGYPEGGRYHYNVQEARNFAGWLETSRIKNAGRLVLAYRTRDEEIEGYSRIVRKPRESKRTPELAPVPSDFGVSRHSCETLREVADARGLSDRLARSLVQSREALDKAQLNRTQVLISEVVEASDGPCLVEWGHRVDAEYFYPASAIKTVASVAALRLVQESDAVDLDTPLVFQDESGPSEASSLRELIRSTQIVSSNSDFNRLFDFAGHEAIHRVIHGAGLDSLRLHHRMFSKASLAEERRAPAVSTGCENGERGCEPRQIWSKRASTYELSELGVSGQHVGSTYIDPVEGGLVDEPMDFSVKNALSLRDHQALNIGLVHPELGPDLGLDETSRRVLLEACKANPEEFQPDLGTDALKRFKPMMPGVLKYVDSRHISYCNKGGRALGFHVENAAVTLDTAAGRRTVFVTASIYANPNARLNDDDYAYDEMSYPFFEELGAMVAQDVLF